MQYFNGNEEAGAYLKINPRKIGLYRRKGLIKAVRGGNGWIYSQDELDRFMATWAGYSLRDEAEIMTAKRMKNNGISGDRAIHEA